MFSVQLHRLLREWVALVAILAMVLGPLSLSVSRGLSAQERVNIAAGFASLPICAPGDNVNGVAGKGGLDCEHCLPGTHAPPAGHQSDAVVHVFAGLSLPSADDPSALLSQLCLPPATGPPSLI